MISVVPDCHMVRITFTVIRGATLNMSRDKDQWISVEGNLAPDIMYCIRISIALRRLLFSSDISEFYHVTLCILKICLQ